MTARRKRIQPDRPAPKLGSWGRAVLRASRVLSGDAKVLIAVLSELDRGSGAFMNDVGLAAQTGSHPAYVRRLRADLVRVGVLKKVEVPGSRLDFWFLVLPADIEREPEAGLTLEQRRRWVRDRADELDTALTDEARSSYAEVSTEARSSYTGVSRVRKNSGPGEQEDRPPEHPGEQENRQADVRTSCPSKHDKAVQTGLSVTLQAVETQRVSHSATTSPPECDTDRSRSETGSATAPPSAAQPNGGLPGDGKQRTPELPGAARCPRCGEPASGPGRRCDEPCHRAGIARLLDVARGQDPPITAPEDAVTLPPAAAAEWGGPAARAAG